MTEDGECSGLSSVLCHPSSDLGMIAQFGRAPALQAGDAGSSPAHSTTLGGRDAFLFFRFLAFDSDPGSSNGRTGGC